MSTPHPEKKPKQTKHPTIKTLETDCFSVSVITWTTHTNKPQHTHPSASHRANTTLQLSC